MAVLQEVEGERRVGEGHIEECFTQKFAEGVAAPLLSIALRSLVYLCECVAAWR